MAVVSEIQFAKIDQATTSTLVAAQPAGTKIRLVSLFLVNTAAQSVTFKSGAGGTALTGAMALAALGTLVLPFSGSGGYFETAAAALLELAQSGATQVSGAVGWVAVS
jgi:hypothetical protein